MVQRTASLSCPMHLVLTVLLAVGLACALAAPPATAHGPDAVIRSRPDDGATLTWPPPQVVVWFRDELATEGSRLRVFDAEGRQVDNGDGGVDLNDPDHAALVVGLPPLPTGTYTVRWRAVFLDGDGVEGSYAFAVGEKVAEGQALTSSESPPGDGLGWVAGLVAGGLGLLLAVAGVLILRHRSA